MAFARTLSRRKCGGSGYSFTGPSSDVRRRPGAEPLLSPSHDVQRLAQIGPGDRRQLAGSIRLSAVDAGADLGRVVLEAHGA